jgi:hypothetical protein
LTFPRAALCFRAVLPAIPALFRASIIQTSKQDRHHFIC